MFQHRLLEHLARSAHAHGGQHHKDNGQNQEQNEQNLGNAGRTGGNTGQIRNSPAISEMMAKMMAYFSIVLSL